MSDPRQGPISQFAQASVLAHAQGGYKSPGPATDVADRMCDILRSAIDVEHRMAGRVHNFADKVMGSQVSDVNPTPTVSGPTTVVQLLSDLERAQANTQRALDRFIDGGKM